MFPQLYTAASGLVAGEQTLELVTGNLANSRTPGYRPDRPLFASYLSEAAQRAVPGGRPAAPNGVLLASSWRGEEIGPLRETGNALDLALRSEGWFRVETPNGERLTRAGSFSRGRDGRLTTGHGYAVLDDKGKPIALPEGRLVVTPDGTLTVDEAVAGRLGIAQAKAAALTREGELLWMSGAPVQPLDAAAVDVRQGYIEESAVNATSELVNLIQAQRMYEMQQRLLDVTANTLARKAIEIGEPR
jgi:flagellar basal body rod protein FlgG